MSFIEAEHVSFTYDDGTPESVPALRDMTLTIEEGEYVAVLGHNGSGKSTFAKLLNLILPRNDLSLYLHTLKTVCGKSYSYEPLCSNFYI